MPESSVCNEKNSRRRTDLRGLRIDQTDIGTPLIANREEIDLSIIR